MVPTLRIKIKLTPSVRDIFRETNRAAGGAKIKASEIQYKGTDQPESLRASIQAMERINTPTAMIALKIGNQPQLEVTARSVSDCSHFMG